MANKKVSQLVSKPSVLVTDLFPIADPTTGQLFKTTISDLGTAIGSGVSSVNTLVGAVVLDTDDIQELASPTNRWFTDTRARAAISAGTGISYNSGTGVITNAVTSGQIATALGYTPADDALVVKLAGSQTITGTKTFQQAPLMDIGVGYKNGSGIYNYLKSINTGWEMPVNGQNHNLIFSTSTNYVYTFPNASGTIALTSDLHNAVTIGTANGLSLSTQVLSLGLSSSIANGALSSADWTTFNAKQAALSGTGFVKISGTTISYDNSTYLTTSAAASTYLALAGGNLTGTTRMDGSGGTTESITMVFNTGINRLLTPVLRLYGSTNVASNYVELFGTLATQNRIINFPDASGTVALTSNLSAYLPLSGGTLTGALGGTSASFSSTVTATAFIPTGSTVPTNGMYLSAANTLSFATSSTERVRITNGALINQSGVYDTSSSVPWIARQGGNNRIISDGNGYVYMPFLTTGSGIDDLGWWGGSGGSWVYNGMLMRISSSARYKKNIRDIEIDTSKIYDLRAISYENNENTAVDGLTSFGLLAEDVAEKIPLLATYNPKNQPEGVQYKMLSVLMLNELKKIKTELETLKNK